MAQINRSRSVPANRHSRQAPILDTYVAFEFIMAYNHKYSYLFILFNL